MSFSRSMVPFLPSLLSASLAHLQLLYPTFISYHISASASPPAAEEETIDLSQFICPMLTFVSTVARGGKAKEWFLTNAEALITNLILWAQMSEEDVRQPYSPLIHSMFSFV